MKLEEEVRKELKEYLKKAGWFIFQISQKGYRCHKGISDSIAVKNGIVIFLEAKREVGGKQSDEQKVFENDIVSHGGNYLCCNSLENLILKIGRLTE